MEMQQELIGGVEYFWGFYINDKYLIDFFIFC